MSLHDLRCDPQDVAGLQQEILRRDKIINALVHQVERSFNSHDTDYALLQNTLALEEKVRIRTDQLKKSVETLELFIANASVGILFIQDHVMLRHNRKFAEIFGFSAQEAIGQSARILFRLDEEYLQAIQVASPLLLDTKPFHTELYMRHQDGSDLWINVMGYVNNAKESDRSTIWFLENRTDVKRADEALRHSHDELEKRVHDRTEALSQQLHFIKQLIEAIPGPFFYKDAKARYLGCNTAFEALTGQSEKELTGKTAYDIASADLADIYLAADHELLSKPGFKIYESQFILASGEVRDMMFHKATITRHDGTIDGIVGLMLDITERKRMEEKLRQAATVFESSAEGVMITKPDGSIIAVNRAFTEITGYPESEVLGKNPRMLQSGRNSKHFYREMWGCIARDDRWLGEVWNRRKNGEIFPEWLSITTVRDKSGIPVNYVATFSDITHIKQNEDRIHLLAYSDQLTKLPNRRLLIDRLLHALASSARSKHHGALFLIDLDDFKYLNDSRGHDVGDRLLQQVAERLSRCVREADTVARFGGDEFVVMLEELSNNVLEATNQIRTAGEHILAVLNEPYLLEDCLHHSTPSIGVTLFGEADNSVDQLLKQADLAMYQAKGSGRNTLRFFDPEMQKVVSLRVSMESDLRAGLKNQQFILHYQPQMNHLNQVIGAEALVRWMHPQRGMVPPVEFIPLAEETELILPLGSWVLTSACHQLSAWAKHPETAQLGMAVNVSARQFRQESFITQVMAALDISGADPVKLKLEITESLLLEDVQAVISKMTVLKARGVCFSLDDFGTGYSSLTYLKRLPLDQLKIDQSFVRDVLIDQNDAAIARTIVALAHSLELGVIAEGVETEAQLLFLASIGCHAYQGFLYSKPLPIEEFMAFLKANQANQSAFNFD